MESKNEFNMMKAIQQAMELSKAFDSNNKETVNNNSNSNSNIDMDSMMKMVQMVKLMNTVAPKQEDKEKEKRNELPPKEFLYEDFNKHVAYFEEDINTPAINTIKSALPYLDYKYQKNIGIAVKFIEIQKILDKYSSATINMDLTKNKYWRRDMILAIRPHMDDEKKKVIDTIIKFMNIKEIMDQEIN